MNKVQTLHVPGGSSSKELRNKKHQPQHHAYRCNVITYISLYLFIIYCYYTQVLVYINILTHIYIYIYIYT